MEDYSRELSQYTKLLFSLNDPVYYTILFIILLFILLYFIFKYIVFPLQRKHLAEKQELELKNARLMALFAELDPDPVIRIDINGIIIFSNDSAKQLLPDELTGKSIREIIPQIYFPIDDYIKSDKSKNITHSFNSRNYSILFRGISSLDIAQIYFHDITEKIEYENRLKDLSNNLQNKIEEDRMRIARELHDGIGQNLLLLKMSLIKNYHDILLKTGKESTFNETINSLESTIKELKSILFNLKPSILEEMGLGPSLTSLVNKISDESNVKGSLNIFGLEKRMDKKLELTLYRIVQEAINNILKHSEATEFSIQLIQKNDMIRILISDDGVGFQSANKKTNGGLGLINIRERVESYRGNFKIDASPGYGTLLIVEIPLELN